MRRAAILLICGCSLLIQLAWASQNTNSDTNKISSHTSAASPGANVRATPNDSGTAFKQACSNPDSPGPVALAIDNQCGNEGNGGKEGPEQRKE